MRHPARHRPLTLAEAHAISKRHHELDLETRCPGSRHCHERRHHAHIGFSRIVVAAPPDTPTPAEEV